MESQEVLWCRVGLGFCIGRWEWSNIGTFVANLFSERQQLRFDLKKQNFQASTAVGSFWYHSPWSLPPGICGMGNPSWVWAGSQDSLLMIKYGESGWMSKSYDVHAARTLFCSHSLFCLVATLYGEVHMAKDQGRPLINNLQATEDSLQKSEKPKLLTTMLSELRSKFLPGEPWNDCSF